MGKPAVFLRIFGCNLMCKWCDSKYATRPNCHSRESGYSVLNRQTGWIPNQVGKDISGTLNQIRKYPCKHLVITGGEPLLQQEELAELLKELPEYYVEMETNGSIPLKITQYIEQINCSPKLSNSNNKLYPLAIKPDNQKAVYKFVITAPCRPPNFTQDDNSELNDLKEVKAFIRTNKIPKNRVWLMPEGVSRTKIIESSKALIEVCKKEGFNFSPRLHVMLWGGKRGK